MTSYNDDCGGKKCGVAYCLDCNPVKKSGAADYETLAARYASTATSTVPTMPENPKAIYGRSKPSLALFPSAALIECAGVFQSGADKYGLANWRKDPVEAMTYANAAMRHLYKWIDGQALDEESGCHELAHAIACLAIVIDAEAVMKLIDDRPHKGDAAQLISDHTKPIPTERP